MLLTGSSFERLAPLEVQSSGLQSLEDMGSGWWWKQAFDSGAHPLVQV